MKESHFFAHLARMQLIQRWPLMRSVSSENISEHSLQVAFVAHALAVIKNKKFGGKVNPERIAILGMYHDTSEVLTGDLPTPVKYYNPDIAKEYKKIEAAAEQKLLSMLPEELQEDFAPYLVTQAAHPEDAAIVKQADSICAYLKCLEELSAGNHEYALAKKRLDITLKERRTPEMEYFLNTFAPSFELTLDEIS
ncbi:MULTISPECIES: 5'-deoxynucleotidase [Vibrio]|uniref:5'-deoxynucleotidase n=2 Tax=Vibrio aestuarianus TaxID=28171 RepID=A0A9X4IX43_9VIBR|nr:MULTISPECIES: 5'-deoxynucleotidase [Vibrio]MDE1210503.1 5'-deoxynucleotidase [Vibrio aestuarianus]MDE1213437.1 5'-deoxynucleotidase [Vibrio aestuarianus]MDE1216425.1 5'-deoxynucleotidase [Vibrio aestuarianus]MDE1221309.1 5'-deoxynucleotidase [Vibrio aestuarianus]MDE1223820.1 5'-deoxynucleotidase [Vibrio aestuarianus]